MGRTGSVRPGPPSVKRRPRPVHRPSRSGSSRQMVVPLRLPRTLGRCRSSTQIDPAEAGRPASPRPWPAWNHATRWQDLRRGCRDARYRRRHRRTADPGPPPRSGRVVRGGRRSRVVLVRLLPRARDGLLDRQQGPAPIGPGDRDDGWTRGGTRPRPRRLRGRRGGRLDQPGAARGLRAPGVLEGPGTRRRDSGLVDRLLRRRPARSRPGRRPDPARRPASRTPGTTARSCSRPTRSRSRRASACRPPTSSRARSRCTSEPASRSSPARQWNATTPVRPIVRLDLGRAGPS